MVATKTENQLKYLRRTRAKLEASFNSALANMVQPGNARTWFQPYLADLLEAYYHLRRKKIDGSKIHLLIGSNARQRFFILIEKTTNRDVKTRSRWAAALARAARKKVQSDAFLDWLHEGGGISGCASRR